MREAAHVALWVALMLAATPQTATGAEPEATSEEATQGADLANDPRLGDPPRERLTDLLFSDDIDRIDFQATTYEEGTGMIETTVADEHEVRLVVRGEPYAESRGTEICLTELVVFRHVESVEPST